MRTKTGTMPKYPALDAVIECSTRQINHLVRRGTVVLKPSQGVWHVTLEAHQPGMFGRTAGESRTIHSLLALNDSYFWHANRKVALADPSARRIIERWRTSTEAAPSAKETPHGIRRLASLAQLGFYDDVEFVDALADSATTRYAQVAAFLGLFLTVNQPMSEPRFNAYVEKFLT
jgi:hypothetical protein